jgi:hypothetical protein
MQLSSAAKLAITSFLIAAALGLLIASAVIDKTYWTFIVLIPAMLVLATGIKIGASTASGGSDVLGFFMMGFFACSIPATILVLKHTDAITTINTILAFLSVAFLCGAMYMGVISFKSESAF